MIFTKRSLSFIVLGYIISFIVGIVFSVLTGFDPIQNPEQAANPPLDFCIAIIVASTLTSVAMSYLYFTHKRPKLKPTMQHGLKFGITMVLVGFILDMILFLPMLLSTGDMSMLLSYYAKPYFYIALLGVVAGSAGVGRYLEKKT